MRSSLFFLRYVCLFSLLVGGVSPVIAQPRHFPPGTHDVFIAEQSGVRPEILSHIAPLVEEAIASGDYPGAVILVGHRNHIVYRGVFGNRRIEPNVAPMRFNTLFDIASLTKVLATTPAIMQLVERGQLDLDVPVAGYWPAFGKNGKSRITARELLTHTSGLPADLPDPGSQMLGENATLEQIEQIRLAHSPGTKFVYSDINFIALGYLVKIITDESIQHYTETHIFMPLGLKDTHYLPAASLRDRIAPTEYIRGQLRWGDVNDPTTYAMGGVSGAAGIFSDASDLGVYAQCMLNGGRLSATAKKKSHVSSTRYLLSPLTILKMTSVQTPLNFSEERGFGWDISSSYANRGILFPAHSFGHTGWTGTSLWIDPVTQTWLVILTSRTHPRPAHINQLIEDRRIIANIVSASIRDINVYNQTNTSMNERLRAYR
jgi:CubicO group peptidase (beta-lactamase class C family)